MPFGVCGLYGHWVCGLHCDRVYGLSCHLAACVGKLVGSVTCRVIGSMARNVIGSLACIVFWRPALGKKHPSLRLMACMVIESIPQEIELFFRI